MFHDKNVDMRYRFLQNLARVCFAVLLVACSTDGKIMEQIYEAEALVQQNPEKALEVISSVDRGAVRGQSDRARYALVVSEALYHNYVDVDSDTLSRPMAEYYMPRQNHHLRARALYQHALVLNRKGVDHLAEAMLMLIEAEKSLAKVDDVKLKGLVHRAKADIYSEGCLFANALESYTKAKECFDRCKSEYHSAYVLYDMGATYIQLRDHQKAHETLGEALDYAIRTSSAGFMAAVLHELLDLTIYMHDYELCRKYLDMFQSDGCAQFGKAHLMSMEAMLLSREGKKSEALAILQRAKGEEGVEWADLEYAHYIVYRNCGDSAKALEWEERSRNAQDKMMVDVLRQPVLNLQIEMLQSNLEAQQREQRLVRERNIIIYICIALIVLAGVYFAWRRIKRKNEDIARYVETISGLNEALSNVPRDLSSSVAALYRDRFSELNELCDIYYDHSGSSRHKNMVFNKLTETIDSIKGDKHRLEELERAVDDYRDGLMARLRTLLPKLSERDYRVALYSFAGFSNRAIAIFIDSDPVSVSKIKYNIKYKMKGMEGDDVDTVVAALSEK